MDLYKKLNDAISGATIEISEAELVDAYNEQDNDGDALATVADLRAWCTTFGLYLEHNTEAKTFSIYTAE